MISLVENLVADDIAAYCLAMRKTSRDYEVGLQNATEQFLQVLEHSDYLPAQLVVAGFELCGGTDMKMILVAARAVQMTHVYATMNHESTHTQLAALNGMHAAHILLANLDAPESLRIKALSITNRALLLYMHARVQQLPGVDTADLSDPLLDCFATELTLNPLHVGMVLADADCAATDAVTAFALLAGKARLTASNVTGPNRYWSDAKKAFQACTLWNSKELRPIGTLLGLQG